MNPQQVYDFLGGAIPLKTLYHYFGTGQLPAKKVGSHWIISKEALVAALTAANEDEPPEGPAARQQKRTRRKLPKIQLW